MHIQWCLKGVAEYAGFSDTEAIAILDSGLPSNWLRQNATGRTRMPRNVVARETHANKIVAPRLKIRRPSTALRRGPAAFEGRQVMLSAKSATPAKRASGIAMPSVMTAYSRRQ
jgi:hypothetical protein